MVWTKIKLGEHADRVTMTLSELAPFSNSKELAISDIGSAGYFEVTVVRIEVQTGAFGIGNRIIVFKVLASADDDVLHEIALDSNTVPAVTSKTWQLYTNAPVAVTTPQYVHLIPEIYIFDGQKLLIEDSANKDSTDSIILHVTGTAHYAKAV